MAKLQPAPLIEKPSFWDEDQILNAVIGANKSVDGVKQLYAIVEEELGTKPAGWAEYRTMQMNQDQADIFSEAGTATELPGAGGVQFAGEVAPFLAVPLVGSRAAAAGIGGLLGSAIYQPELDTGMRVATTAFGAALGGLFGRSANAAQRAAAEHANKLAARADRFVGPPLPQPRVGPPTRAQAAARDVDSFVGPPGPARVGPPTAGRMAEDFLGPPAPARVGPMATAQQLGSRVGQRVGSALRGAGRASQRPIRSTAGPLGRMTMSDIVPPQMKAQLGARAAESNKLDAIARAQQTIKDNQIDEAFVKQAQKNIDARQKQLDEMFEKVEAAAQRKKDNQALQQQVRDLRNEQTAGLILKQRVNDLLEHPVIGNQLKKGQRAARIARNQSGNIDPRLAAVGAGAGVGGVAGGAVTGDPMGALGGALAGAALAPALLHAPKYMARRQLREASREGGKFNERASLLSRTGQVTKGIATDALQAARKVLDDFAGATDTRIAIISPAIAAALRATEFATHSVSGNWIRQAEPFFMALDRSGLTEKQLRDFKGMLMNDRSRARGMLTKWGKNDLAQQLDEVSGTLDEVGDYLRANGLGTNLRENYFPRRVTNPEMFDIPEVQSYFQHLARQKGVTQLTTFQKEEAISELLNGALKGGVENQSFTKAAKSLKQRKLNTVTDETVDAYADPKEAFNSYIEEIVKHVETQKFFKGQGVDDAMTPHAANLNGIVDKMRQKLMDKDLSLDEVEELTELLKMRFGPGEQAPHKMVQNFKNLTYTGLLGNPIAAATQLGDLALSFHKNGIANTASAIVKVLASRGKPMSNGLDKETLLGLRDAAQDFVGSEMNTRKLLDWSLKYSTFRGADRLGKNTFINAAMSKNMKLSREDFIQQWKPWFQGETGKLYDDVQDFARNGLTNANKDRIGLMLWNSLSDVQPISLSTLPKKYLQHPNGRMAYMLQSFTLRLFNTMREDIIQKAAGNKRLGIAPDPKGALKNTVKLGAFFTLLNGGTDALKDFMLGRDMKGVDELMTNNLLKMLGLNKFIVDQANRQGVGATALQIAGPPMALLDTFGDAKRAVGMLPLGGRFIKEAIQ